MKTLLFILFSILSLPLFSQEIERLVDNTPPDPFYECRENAAFKLIDSYSLREKVIDVDIIEIPNEDTNLKCQLSIQWSSTRSGDTKIYWINGLLKMDRGCCNTSFSVKDHSKNIDVGKVNEYLGCTKEFIQRSLGLGNAFKKKRKKKKKVRN